MKYIRIAVIVLLACSLEIYGAGVVRERANRDPSMPVITSDRQVLEISTAYQEEDLLAGLTAYDEEDGDLTDQILVGEFSQFVEKGLANLSYVVFDSANQPASFSRQVRFTDYRSPILTLTEPLVFSRGETENTASRIGAQDVLDGDISSLVTETDSTVDYQTPGAYTVSVEVSNSFGDVEAQTLPVHVTEAGSRELDIQLTEPLVYLTPGEAFDPYAYLAGLLDASGETLDASLVEAESGVDPAAEGCYEVHYYADDGEGRNGETWLTVIVRA
ncbi:MAG TPA: hypothetical protein IAA57_04565 [Candidatus Pullilachnospira intestinigallinarum]|nr:hypothetical protein [Candidatus Pullilachnospira intestinigallinarum]